MSSGIEAALVRHRAISIAALFLLALLAWIWLIAGAGMEMEPLVSLAPPTGHGPHAPGMAMAEVLPWSAGRFVLIFSMWLIMMVAMMLPSAAPMILLFARAATNAQSPIQPATASFLAGYFLAWGGFSFVATLLQFLLELLGLLVPMAMASQSRWLSIAILVAAGIYQLSPLKDVCLRHCRNPARFLSLHYQPGWIGALRMGLIHGSYCVGCCWLLMGLLFVGGVMNLAWIALLTLIVATEKLLPFGRHLSIGTGLAFIAWAIAMLVG